MFRRLRPFLWTAGAVLLVVGFIGAVARLHHPVYGFTTLLPFDASDEAHLLPEVHDRPAFINRLNGGYDGLYYAQIACRPLLRDPALFQAIDNLGYRARRILTCWLAWALAGGDSTRALEAYAIVNPLCWLALAGLLCGIFPLRSGHDLLAWAGVMFSAGALASVRLALVDLPALLLLVGMMLAVQRGRLNGAVGWLAAAGLTRETSLLALPVLVRGTPRTTLWRAAAVTLPLLLWLLYIRIVVGPGSHGWGNLDWPGVRWFEKWQATLAGFQRADPAVLNWTTLLALLAITVQVAWLLVRPQWQNLWWRGGIGYAVLALGLGAAVWEGHPGAAARVLLPLNLAFNALAPRTRAGLALLILGNLTVPAGLLQLASLPNDGVELAAVRTADATVLVQTRSGWFGVERDLRNFWAWSSGDAELVVQSRPAGTALNLNFRLRSLTPRVVSITQSEVLLWRGLVGQDWQPVAFRCTDGLIRFQTDTPPALENDAPGARRLAFILERLQVSGIQSTPATHTAPSGR